MAFAIVENRKMVKTGLDILALSKFKRLEDLEIGLLIHSASVDSCLKGTLELLLNADICNIKIIFSPEHGLTTAAQDMISVASSHIAENNIPIKSLYGHTPDTLFPTLQDLLALDLLLIDLQDIGTRYYTYMQTMAYCMQVAAKARIKVLVLDRPNPIGGLEIEGSSLYDNCRSFCGLLPVPQRHGLTIGEAAMLYNRGISITYGKTTLTLEAINCDLEILKMEGWSREMYFSDTGLPWVLPSPNMPTQDTALVYPGGCLFEATNISEGRGTTKPFEILGAPFIDGKLWADTVCEQALWQKVPLSGAVLRPLEFQPQFHKWSGQCCGGLQIHITDTTRTSFKPFRWGLAMLSSLYHLYSQYGFAWRSGTYEFIDNIPAIDLLFGSSSLRDSLESRKKTDDVLYELASYESAYRDYRKPYLLY